MKTERAGMAVEAGGEDPLDLLVVILNYKTSEMTEHCLESLEGEVSGEHRVGVVVVENGSGDDSAARLEEAVLRHGFSDWATVQVEERNYGFAGGNLRACESGPAARYVLLLNSDTLVEPGSLAYCIEKMDGDPKIGALGIRQLLMDGTLENNARKFPTPPRALAAALGLPWRFPKAFAWANTEDLTWDRLTTCRDVDWVGGAFLFARTDMFRETSGFLDEDFFFTGEDCEFCHRVWRAGYRCVYDPAVHVNHMHAGSSDPKKIARKAMMSQTWRARYLVQRKCWGRPAAWSLRAADVAVLTARWLKLSVLGRRQTDEYEIASTCLGLITRPLKRVGIG